MSALCSDIHLNIFAPGCSVKKVRVSSFANVTALESLYPRQKRVFIYQGSILSRNNAFCNYSMKDGDFVVSILDQTSEIGNQQKWIRLTSKDNSSSSSLRNMLDVTVVKEITRLRDLRYQKLESKPRKFRLVCREVELSLDRVKQRKSVQTNYEKPEIIPTAALPNFWSATSGKPQTILRQNSISSKEEFLDRDQTQTETI